MLFRSAVAVAADKVGIQLTGRGLDCEDSAARHGVARIDRQIHQNLLELPDINENIQINRSVVNLEFDIIGKYISRMIALG